MNRNQNKIRKQFCFIGCSLMIFISCANKSNQTTEPEDVIVPPEGYELVWNDEFNSDIIDTSKWEFEVNADGGGNNELQYYTDRPENAYLDSGKLVIKAIHATYTGDDGVRDYTSARLRTKYKGDWLYGRFVIRAKLPAGQGLWPAIWMLPTDWEYGDWAASGEIDIMELLGQGPNKVYGTLHYGGPWPDNVHTGDSFTLPSGDFVKEYHIFSLEWEEGVMRWYVDDSLYETQTNWYTSGADFPAPFDKRFHLILNVAVGGNWPGNPDETTEFPQTIMVDYVRVFQKIDQ